MVQAFNLPIIAGLFWKKFLNKGPNFQLECLLSCWQFSLSPEVRPFRRSVIFDFQAQSSTYASKWLKLSTNSVTAAFELSAFECGICRTTLNNLVFWYFWLKKGTWLLVRVSFLTPLFVWVVKACRVFRSPRLLQFSWVEVREHPKTWLPPARA